MYEMRTGRSRHQVRQTVAEAVAAGEVQVETMSKEAALFPHFGPWNMDFPHFGPDRAFGSNLGRYTQTALRTSRGLGTYCSADVRKNDEPSNHTAHKTNRHHDY